MRLRKAAVAGGFYPSDPKELSLIIDRFLESAALVSLPKNAKLRALAVPHAGYIYSGIVAASGFKLLSSKLQAPSSKIILIGPSHQVAFRGAAIDDNVFWETPLGKVKTQKLKFKSNKQVCFWRNKVLFYDSRPHQFEHSLEVQVPFLQRVLKDFKILPILTGEVDYRELGDRLLRELKYNETIIIVSSDLSHYYSYEEAKRIDRVANEAIPALDIERVEREVEACGKTGILTVMHLAKRLGWKGKLLDHRNSGDTAGDKDKVVGYGAYGFYEIQNSKCKIQN